jgi:hypothetical protein
MTPLSVSTRNITRVFRATTPADRAGGQVWYVAAHRIALSLDPADPTRAAAVIAVLSPMLSWPRNVVEARNVYSGQPVRALGSSARKARMILAGGDPEQIVSGRKVHAFWRTIADPAEPSAVVIDRHAIDIAAGRVLGDKIRGRHLRRAGAYDEVAEKYRRAARRRLSSSGRSRLRKSRQLPGSTGAANTPSPIIDERQLTCRASMSHHSRTTTAASFTDLHHAGRVDGSRRRYRSGDAHAGSLSGSPRWTVLCGGGLCDP